MTDAVFVRGLEFEANHGYTASERRSTRRFRLSMEITASLERAQDSDKLSDTIDYRGLCEAAIEVGTTQTFKLLEALAGAIIDRIQQLHPSVAVTLELEKLAPPCRGVPESCGVRVSRPPR